jgi:hypothetical protein
VGESTKAMLLDITILYRLFRYVLDFLSRIDIGFFSKEQYRDAVGSYRELRKLQQDPEKSKSLPPQILGQMPLDPRWERDPNQPEQFHFNHTTNTTRRNDEYWQKFNTRIQSSTCTVQQLIESLQNLNKELPISTDLVAFRNSPSLIYANNQKQRRLRRLRHELDMTRRLNQYKQRLYNQKLFLYKGVHTDQIKPAKPMDHSRHEKLHLIRDIDDIQEMYDEACLEAVQVEQEQRMLLQKTRDDQQKEIEVLRRMTKQYLNTPVSKDEDYREINKQVFQEYDDDPFHMAIHEVDEKEGNINHENMKIPFFDDDRMPKNKYPKLKVHSKKTEQDRETRRTLLLSSPYANSVKSMEKEAWNVEVDRISGVLAAIMPKE